jgi:hypothetical protein
MALEWYPHCLPTFLPRHHVGRAGSWSCVSRYSRFTRHFVRSKRGLELPDVMGGHGWSWVIMQIIRYAIRFYMGVL